MATYTRKYCPHCGKIYQSYSTMTKEMTVPEGCPIISCPNCGEQFLDKDIKEPGFKEKPPKSANILTCFIAPIFPFLLGGILFLMGGFVIEDSFIRNTCAVFGIGALGLYALIVWSAVKNLDDINEDALMEYEDSKERLEDEEYVILLIKLGYRVPKKFLAKHYPHLIGKKFK